MQNQILFMGVHITESIIYEIKDIISLKERAATLSCIRVIPRMNHIRRIADSLSFSHIIKY